MTDNIFEIETTLRVPARVMYFIDSFCRCKSWCQSFLDLFLCSREQNCLSLFPACYEEYTTTEPRMWNSQERLVNNLSWPGRLDVGAFQLEVSVDQDLSVIVAEAIDDDVVKQWLVLTCFHARVTQQRSTSSKTRLSCSHVHEKTHPCKPGFEKKREPHKLMLKTR